jgi:hypothetical protein
MNSVKELQAFLESQGFNPLVLIDSPEAQEIIEEIFNANMFFSNVADGDTYKFSDDELRNYLSEAFDGGEEVLVPEIMDALRIAQIFWNSDYTPEQQEDMTQFFNNMYESFEGRQLYPTLEENITFYEQVRATVGGDQQAEDIGELPTQEVDTDNGLLTVPPVTTNMIPGMTGQFGSWSWLDYWGDVNPEIDDFFEEWVDRYNTESGTEFFNEEAFLNEFRYGENGINTQPWWRDVANGFKDHLQFWYSSGGRGTLGLDTDSLRDSNPYNRAMDEFRELARNAIVDFGLDEFLLDGTITEQDITRYATRIMSSGGATYKLGKGIELNPENFANKANQVVQKMLSEDFVGEDGQFLKPEKDFGPGSVTKLINEWKVLAKKQFMDIPENQLRKWAMDVKTETGLTTEMVEQKINEMAFSRVDFPFTPDEREDYASRGMTMQELLQPQYSAVVGPYGWNDSSIQPDDPWLMDNYMFVDDNGNRRFRTAAEMRDHSRTNMERFQHSPIAQNFFNDFITGVSSMMRSDY